MARIQVLPDGLVDRIAAGEVVERPASVVKELVENSLDAGASTIEVRLRSGGKSRIEVRDDGSGMAREDAVLAVQRHATSKLSAVEDLDAIATLGFRGEALSSIAAVSRFLLRTATIEGRGHEVEVRGGRVDPVREIGHPRGTTLRVDDLFFNVPARRKFLRTDGTELAHALRWLTRFSLAYPHCAFRLDHGERRSLDVVPTADRLERIAQLHGREFAEKLLPFRLDADGLALDGFAGRPVDALARRDRQHVFVNGRVVQDRMLAHAVTQAYGNTMPGGRHPAMFLFLRLEPGGVDVNVHPQKTEVRFRDPSRIHELVRATVGDALGQRTAVPELADLRPARGPREAAVRDAALRYQAAHEARPELARATAPTAAGSATPVVESGQAAEGVGIEHAAVPLAQFLDSYIVAQDADGLVLVDQHAAHERVLFERYLRQAEENRVEVQRLLFPRTVELTPDEAALLERDREEFVRLGFRLEPFGGGSFRIEAVPAVASEMDAEGFLRELLGVAGESRSAAADVAALRRKLVTTAACHAAIKINHPLSAPAMQALLDDLYGARNPTTCPHGRPILFRLPLDEIERAFQRR